MHSKGYVESLEDVPSVADMANQDTGSGADKWTGDSFTASALKGASFQTISILVFTSTGIGTKKTKLSGQTRFCERDKDLDRRVGELLALAAPKGKAGRTMCIDPGK